LRDNRWQLPAGILANKKKLWKKGLTLVSPSRWLAARAAESSLFRDFRIEVIANSLDSEIYCVRDKQEAKLALAIKPEQTTLLFSSLLGRDKRKGLDLLLQTLKLCLKNPLWRKAIADGQLLILTLGPYQEELREAGIPIRPCGILDDDEKLAGIYQAADLLVIPSREENLPNVMLEALACATPVLSFAVGGLPDVIKDGENGFMALPFACDQLAMHLQKVVFDPALRRRLGENSRRLIEQSYTLKRQAQNYLTLFNELLNHKNYTPGNSPPAVRQWVAGDIELGTWPSPIGDFLLSPYRESALALLQGCLAAQESPQWAIRRCISLLLGWILHWPVCWFRKTVQRILGRPRDAVADEHPHSIQILDTLITAAAYSQKDEYLNGIHLTKKNMFFLTKKSTEFFPIKVGSRMKFAKAGEATVTEISSMPGGTPGNTVYFIMVDRPLDPHEDGFPKPIEWLFDNRHPRSL
jgi:hypothetical protein